MRVLSPPLSDGISAELLFHLYRRYYFKYDHLKETSTIENLWHLSMLVAYPVAWTMLKNTNVFIVNAYFIMHLSAFRTSVFILGM
jgi:hypothetical protein